MKFGIYIHPRRPKISKKHIETILESLHMSFSDSNAEIALVVGGDGTFSWFGRTLSIPMLFVGVKDTAILGSKGRLAEISLENLSKALLDIKAGNYRIMKTRMISVQYNNLETVDVLSDVYVERGTYAGCIRYSVDISRYKTRNSYNNHNENENRENGQYYYLHGRQAKGLTDYVIGNGVIISTSLGSGGYYSYIDRVIKGINISTKQKRQLFDDNAIGICHILPVFASRTIKRDQINDNSNNNDFQESLSCPIRYTVPFRSNIRITLLREADVHLYGTTEGSEGIPIKVDRPITITPSNRIARIIELRRAVK